MNLEETLLADLTTGNQDYKHKLNVIRLAFKRYYWQRKIKDEAQRDLEQMEWINSQYFKKQLRNES